MKTYLSLLTVIVLLVGQRAVLLMGDLTAVMMLLGVHMAGIAFSCAESRRLHGSWLPQYSLVPVISDAGHGGGQAISIQRDDVAIGSLVGGLFFGIPTVRQILSADSPWTTPWEIGAVLILVAVTPVSLFMTWKRLRQILWALPVALLVYASLR